MNIPISDIDFYSDAIINDPYPAYAKLRKMGPVVYLAKDDLYVVARYKEVSEVLLQPLRLRFRRKWRPTPTDCPATGTSLCTRYPARSATGVPTPPIVAISSTLSGCGPTSFPTDTWRVKCPRRNQS